MVYIAVCTLGLVKMTKILYDLPEENSVGLSNEGENLKKITKLCIIVHYIR